VMFSLREGGTLEGLAIRSVWKEWHVASLSGVEWWKRIDTETVDFFVHSSLGDIWSLVVLVVMLALHESCTLESGWIRSVWNEWVSALNFNVEWWKSFRNETMDLLVHSSFGNIWSLVLVMLSLREGGTLEGLTIGSVWKEWHVASLSGVEWWKRIYTETLDFLVHSSLSDIWSLVVLLVVFSFREGSTFESLWIRTVRKEWVSALNFNVEWWKSLLNETMDFFVHSSLSNIWSLVVLSVVISLT